MASNQRRIAELQEAKDALYHQLEVDYDRIERLYKKNPVVAEQLEDFWLADLKIFERTVDELRELTA